MSRGDPLEDPRQRPLVLLADDWRDFELIDSGDGRKLERYGPLRFIRPEPQALWRPSVVIAAIVVVLLAWAYTAAEVSLRG